jgi:hypothetical protein
MNQKVKFFVFDMGLPLNVMVVNGTEWLVTYQTNQKTTGIIVHKRSTFRLSYGMRHSFTLNGHFDMFSSVGGTRFAVFLIDYSGTCTTGRSGTWKLYSTSGQLEAKIGRFCPGRPCHDDEGCVADAIDIFFDNLHSNQGTVIVLYNRDRTAENKQKRPILVSYRFVMVGGQLERTELQTLVKERIVPMEEELKLYLRTFATLHPAQIFVWAKIKCTKYNDYYLYFLHKSNGFKKEEIFGEKFPLELKSFGSSTFDPVMNRIFYMSSFSRPRKQVIKAIQMDCDWKIIITRHQLNITYVREFKKWKEFDIDQTGNVFITDDLHRFSADLDRIVPDIY